MRPVLVNSRQFDIRARPRATPWGWYAVTGSEPRLSLFDHDLRPLGQVELTGFGSHPTVAPVPHGERFVVADRQRVAMVDRTGRVLWQRTQAGPGRTRRYGR